MEGTEPFHRVTPAQLHGVQRSKGTGWRVCVGGLCVRRGGGVLFSGEPR